MHSAAVNTGELIYYTPVFGWPGEGGTGLVISNTLDEVTPYVLLVNGKIVNAMRSEVRSSKFNGI